MHSYPLVKMSRGLDTVRRALIRTESARVRADDQKALARDSMNAAVRVLTRDLGLSVRDAADLLGVSYQRVQQLA